jgi:NAD(P)-dependent dehydrogenase (short-subunit alcohol dehydrogenase family)
VTTAGSGNAKGTRVERDLQDRVAIVTGAARGIGGATARRLAAGGARLVIADSDAGPLAGIRDAIHALGGQAVVVKADAASVPGVAQVVAEALEAFHRIDILVNGGGAVEGQSQGQTESEAWERHLALNVTGCLLCCRAVMPHMQARRYGKIVNIASSAGHYRSSYFPYDASPPSKVSVSASDGGVLALTRELAFEVARHGIYVNAVAPGWILTDPAREEWRRLPEWARNYILAEISLRRAGQPEEVASVVHFLASDASSYVTGTVVDVNGGWWMS